MGSFVLTLDGDRSKCYIGVLRLGGRVCGPLSIEHVKIKARLEAST